jgi:hypothetical protein
MSVVSEYQRYWLAADQAADRRHQAPLRPDLRERSPFSRCIRLDLAVDSVGVIAPSHQSSLWA